MPWSNYVPQLCDVLGCDQYKVTIDIDIMNSVTKF